MRSRPHGRPRSPHIVIPAPPSPHRHPRATTCDPVEVPWWEKSPCGAVSAAPSSPRLPHVGIPASRSDRAERATGGDPGKRPHGNDQRGPKDRVHLKLVRIPAAGSAALRAGGAGMTMLRGRVARIGGNTAATRPSFIGFRSLGPRGSRHAAACLDPRRRIRRCSTCDAGMTSRKARVAPQHRAAAAPARKTSLTTYPRS